VKVVWTPEAEQDRDDIWLHIAVDNIQAAVRLTSFSATRQPALPTIPS